MKGFNRFLTAFAVAVLIVSVWLLGYLRQRANEELRRTLQSATRNFVPERILHGPGGDTLLRFGVAETLVGTLTSSPYVRAAVLSKLVQHEGHVSEQPVVPFTLYADEGDAWRDKRIGAGWQRLPLGDPQRPFGYLYLDLNTYVLKSINWAIGAISLALALVLITLLTRLWTQESSLTRTVIELNDRRRELIRLERLALAGQLAAGLLHDLRKPVLHIQHSLEDLTEALGDFAPAAAGLQEQRRQTRLFFQMLADSQFERFVQSDRSDEEYVDVLSIVDQSLNLVKYERRGVEVLIKDAEGLPLVLAHPYRLIQLFSNLILNAYQALGGRGRLTIETTAERGGILVNFTDDGPGVPAEALPHIFEPFFTTKGEGEGTGLGLSICRLIVEDLGGRLQVDSRPGGPTSFRVWLPGAAEAPTADSAP